MRCTISGWRACYIGIYFNDKMHCDVMIQLLKFLMYIFMTSYNPQSVTVEVLGLDL